MFPLLAIFLPALILGVLLFYAIPKQWRAYRDAARTAKGAIAVSLTLSAGLAAGCIAWLLLLGYCAAHPQRIAG